jgi:exopolysaccharide production protein ExoQ
MIWISQGSSTAPGRLERMTFVFVLLVQQNAFVSVPMMIKYDTLAEMRGVENIFNTIGVALSLLLIGWISLRELRSLIYMGRRNLWQVLFACLVLLSAIWSIHPDITLRRGVGYILTIVVAALLPIRFGISDSMKVLSASFAVSAVGSLAFVALFPQYGIMHMQDLEGCWQGVFCTKELLGSVMAVAIFVELYILVENAGTKWWRYCLLAAYGTLLILSRSMTASIITLTYVAGVCVYLLWGRNGWRSVAALTTITCALFVGSAIVLPDAQSAFGMIGKDPTLTGRVSFWPSILKLVDERPLLGWGYRAMWQPDDPTTASVDSVAGFAVPQSHNALLEIALWLGWVGVLVMGIMICLAFWRGVQCCANGFGLLGWFSLMFFVGTVLSGITGENLGENQVIEWLVFSALFFSCGMCAPKVEREQ